MAQKDAKPPRPPVIVLADLSVPFPEMTGAEPWRQTDREEWFPVRGHNATATRLCHSCLQMADCRAWALNNPELASDGIRGGMTRAQRADLRRSEMRQTA